MIFLPQPPSVPRPVAQERMQRRLPYRGKLANHRAIIPERERAGVGFKPLMRASDGVPHPAAVGALIYAADLAARKTGASRKAFVKRWTHEVTVAIFRRRAALMRQCFPKESERENTGWAGAPRAGTSCSARSDAERAS